jgi:hypothetical protein
MRHICSIFIRFDTTGGIFAKKGNLATMDPKKTTAVVQLAHFIILPLFGTPPLF